MVHLGGTATPYGWKTGVHNTGVIHYLHAGAPIVWYAFANQHTEDFLGAMRDIVRVESGWSDTPTLSLSPVSPDSLNEVRGQLVEGNWMVRPESLVASNGSLFVTRTIQNVGDWLCTLPGVYYSGFCTGRNISESIAVALPDWTGRKTDADLLVRDCGFAPLFCTDTLVAEEMRRIRGRKAFSGDEMKKLIPPVFTNMVQETVRLLEKVMSECPTSIQEVGSMLWREYKAKGVVPCQKCNICTSWAFVICPTHHAKAHCLRHYVEAGATGVVGLTIHLPEDWIRLKAWAGMVAKSRFGPFLPSHSLSRGLMPYFQPRSHRRRSQHGRGWSTPEKGGEQCRRKAIVPV